MKEPRPAFCYRVHKEADRPGVRFVTLVVPYRGAVPKVSVTIPEPPSIGSSRVELRITVDGASVLAGYDLDAKTAWLRDR